MKEDELGRMKVLLREALPPVSEDGVPERDLWPAMLRRMDAKAAGSQFALWFDGALLAGLAGVVVVFPKAIPLLLYYL